MAERVNRSRAALLVGLLLRRVALLIVLLALAFLAVDVLPSDAAQATLGPDASPAEIGRAHV